MIHGIQVQLHDLQIGTYPLYLKSHGPPGVIAIFEPVHLVGIPFLVTGHQDAVTHLYKALTYDCCHRLFDEQHIHDCQVKSI